MSRSTRRRLPRGADSGDLDTRGGLNRNIILLSIVSFFADLAGEMLYPLIPIFLTTVLGAPPAIVGLIEGVAESVASLLRAVSGWLSDRIGERKRLVMLGYGLAALAKPLLALAFGWPIVFLARLLDRVGKGIRGAPRDALIADWSTEATRGRAFGFHRALDTAGAVGGPLIAILGLRLLHGDIRLLFLVAFVPSAVAVALLVPLQERRRGAQGREAPQLSLRLTGYDRRFKVFLLAMLVFALGNSSDAFLILRAKDLGLSTTATVLAYVLYNAVYASLSLPAGIRSDRVGRRNLIVAGLLIFAGVYAGFALVTSPELVWMLFAVYGAYIALTDGVGKALVADLAPAGAVGTALGLYNTLGGLMVLEASVTAGLLWEHVGPAAPFIYGAATACVAALLLLVLLPAGAAVQNLNSPKA